MRPSQKYQEAFTETQTLVGMSGNREGKMDIDDVKKTEYDNVVIKWTLVWEREKT